MAEVVLEIKNVSKSFKVRQGGNAGLKESLWQLISNNKADVKDFYALKDISFAVRKGEALGIIGKNGAGKSTLLRILSGITQPDSGEINFYGKAVSILDIGTGFHPELTGRENIYLSASIYGFTKQEIDSRLSEIIDFSGIGEFVEQPVKNYSAGMYLRLAFSIIANLDAEIYLIDEVIGVGDAAFQQKSRAKIESLLKQGKTLIVVSHNLNDIATMCNRILLMEDGQITEEGDEEVIRTYVERSMPEYFNFSDGKHYHVQPEIGTDERFTAVNILNCGITGEKNIKDGISTLHPFKIFVEVAVVEDINLDVTIRFHTSTDIILFVGSTYKQELTRMDNLGKYRVEFEIPARLLNENIYSVDLLLVNNVKPEHINNPDVDTSRIYYREIDKCLTIKMADELALEGKQQKYPGAIRPQIPVQVISLQ